MLKNGNVLVFGKNEFGNLGLGNSVSQSSPTMIAPRYLNNEKVIKADASGYNIILLTETGKVYVAGSSISC